MASAEQDVRAGGADESLTGAAASGAAIAERYGLEFLAAIEPAYLDPELIRELPVEWARTNVILPIRIGHRPCALTSDPTQINQCEYLSLLLGQDVQPVVSTASNSAYSANRSNDSMWRSRSMARSGCRSDVPTQARAIVLKRRLSS